MRLPGIRYGTMFTRYKFDTPFHFISVSGGLEMIVQAFEKNIMKFGAKTNELFNYSRLNDMIEELRKYCFNVVYEEVENTATEIIIDEDELSTIPLVKSIVKNNNATGGTSLKRARQLREVKHVNNGIKYVVTFSISMPEYDYANDYNNRKRCFECLYQYIQDNKVNYKYDELLNINSTTNAESTNDIKLMQHKITFSIIFNELHDLAEFLEYRTNLLDSYQSVYNEYSPIYLGNHVVLQESLAWTMVSSALEMKLELLFDYDNGNNYYMLIISYSKLSLIEDCVNEFIQHCKELGDIINYSFDEKLKQVIIFDVNCAIKEHRKNYYTKYRHNISSSFIVIIQNIVAKYEIKRLYDVD